jgi:hypothetical protein
MAVNPNVNPEEAEKKVVKPTPSADTVENKELEAIRLAPAAPVGADSGVLNNPQSAQMLGDFKLSGITVEDGARRAEPVPAALDAVTAAKPVSDAPVDKVVDTKDMNNVFVRDENGRETRIISKDGVVSNVVATGRDGKQFVMEKVDGSEYPAPDAEGQKVATYKTQDGGTWTGRVEVNKDGSFSYIQYAGDAQNSKVASKTTYKPDGSSTTVLQDNMVIERSREGIPTSITAKDGTYTGDRLQVDAKSGNARFIDNDGNTVTVRPDGSRQVMHPEALVNPDGSARTPDLNNPKRSIVEQDAAGRVTSAYDSNGTLVSKMEYDPKTGEPTFLTINRSVNQNEVGQWKNENGKWVSVDGKTTLGKDGTGVRVESDGSYTIPQADGTWLRRNPDGSTVKSALVPPDAAREKQQERVTEVITADNQSYKFGYGLNPKGEVEMNSVTNRSGTWKTDLTKAKGEDGRTWTTTTVDGKTIHWTGENGVDKTGRYSFSERTHFRQRTHR